MTVDLDPKDLYKIKTIASLTGFSPTLLRAWERRYGLLIPVRTPTGHRLYTPDDLRILRRVRVLFDQGRSIGEIVAQGRQRLLSVLSEPGASGHEAEAAVQDLSYPELHRCREEIVQAALELDDVRIQRVLDRAFASVSALPVLEHLVIPLAREMGRLWARQIASVAAEHLLSSLLQRKLQRLIEAEGQRPSRSSAICCGFPDEFHELGPLMLTYCLLQAGLRVVYLGAALPFYDLARAIQIKQPQWVMLSVTRAALLEVHKPALIQLIRSTSVPCRFILGGSAVKPAEHGDLQTLGVILWSADVPLSQLTMTLKLTP